MNVEIWRDVVGYEGLYMVSNYGRVKSLPKYNIKDARIMKQTSHPKNRRMSVMLCKSPTERKRITVHRLVALAFVDNPFGYVEVNHKDENPQNNRADNLEWCTHKYNMNYGTTPKRLNIKNMKPVAFIEDGKIVAFVSIRSAKQYGFDGAGILKSIKTGRKYKGNAWFYVYK